MYPTEESPNLNVGDEIIWQGEEIKSEGEPAAVSPGMRWKVLSLHEGDHLDVNGGGTIPARVVVQFENGMSLLVDQGMKWEKLTEG